MGLSSLFTQAVNSAINISVARQVINQGLIDALYTMENMCGNEGQTKVFNDYVRPEFIKNKQTSSIEEGWTPVDIGEYMDFMGEIVGEGNDIMEAAYHLAQEILSEFEAAAEANEEEE